MKLFKKNNNENKRFYIQWHLLDHCNLHCNHCYQPDAILQKITYENALKVIHKLEKFFENKDVQPQINLTGGEPLLYDKLFPLIDEILKRGWKWALLTNGTLLDQQLVAEIKKRNPVFVQVSLEGGEELNDECRGKGTYSKICNAMDLLVENQVKSLVSFTITSKNWADFSEAARVCREHNVHKLWCDRYVGNDELAISTDDFTKFLEILREERKNTHSTTIIAAERALQFLADGSCYRCNAGGDLLIIMPDGTLLPCRRLPLPLGNILNSDSIRSVLDISDTWKQLQKKLYSSDCIKCSDFDKCRGGAKCVTYAQTGNLFMKDINCPIHHLHLSQPAHLR